MDLTDYTSASARRVRGQATPMDVFVTDWEPAGDCDVTRWRQQLHEAVEHEVWNEMLSACVKQDILHGQMMIVHWKRDIAFYLFATVALVVMALVFWVF